jgi:hypothetical protein
VVALNSIFPAKNLSDSKPDDRRPKSVRNKAGMMSGSIDILGVFDGLVDPNRGMQLLNIPWVMSLRNFDVISRQGLYGCTTSSPRRVDDWQYRH